MIDKEIHDLINQVVDKLEASGAPVPAHKVNGFMVDCLNLIRDKCPEVAKDAILVAERFSHGTASPDEMYMANLACWKYLDKHKATTNTNNIEYCRIRAVICALCSEIDLEYMPELLQFFIEMMCKSGGFRPKIKDRLKIHFLA